MADQKSEIRYLTAPSIDTKKKKYCRFKKSGIKYIDYKDPEFLKKFLNEQGKILPRTFSWWASWLNEHEDAMHICPAKRYGNLYMIPDGWIKIAVE